MRVLGVAFNLDAGLRPGWQVLAAGLVVVLIDLVWGRASGRKPRRRALAAE